MSIHDFEVRLNKWGQQKVPFLFVVDFELETPFACKLEETKDQNILFDIDGHSNSTSNDRKAAVIITKYPIPLAEYQKKFDVVADHLHYGDSFLTNLTIKTKFKPAKHSKNYFSWPKPDTNCYSKIISLYFPRRPLFG